LLVVNTCAPSPVGEEVARKGSWRGLEIERPKSPRHATYHNAFKALNIAAMEQALAGWAKDALPAGAIIAMDGKTLRGSRHAE
jgi:hypothetical protein